MKNKSLLNKSYATFTMFWASRFGRTSSALASGYSLHHLRRLVLRTSPSFGGFAAIPLAARRSDKSIYSLQKRILTFYLFL